MPLFRLGLRRRLVSSLGRRRFIFYPCGALQSQWFCLSPRDHGNNYDTPAEDRVPRYWDKFTPRAIMNARALTPEDLAAYRLKRLEGAARAEVGDLEAARRLIAHRLGCSPGQLERARKRRLKGIRAALADKIRDLFVAALRNEMRGMRDEIEQALADSPDLDSLEVGVVLAALDAREPAACGAGRRRGGIVGGAARD